MDIQYTPASTQISDDFLSTAMSCKEAPLIRNVRQLDAGQGQVVATDRYNRAYYLSGAAWYRLGTVPIAQVSVGPAGIWGVRNNGWVYKFVAGNFRRASGKKNVFPYY